jgi:hypothetical protein
VSDTTELPAHSLQALLAALATVTCEVAEHLETTSSGIGQDLVKAAVCSHDVMVKLQDFDRMRQQLMAVGDVLTHCATLILNAAPHNVTAIVSQLPMRQMRHRLQDAIDTHRGAAAERVLEADQVF